MATKKIDYTGGQIANQLMATLELLKAFGFETEELSVTEAFAIKSSLLRTLEKNKMLTRV